jgi:hypothetical protein
MGLRSFVRVRNFVSIAVFLDIVFTVCGCGGLGSPLAADQTARGIKVTVTPASTTVPVAGTKKFTASVANTPNTAVVWQVNGTTGGESTHGTIDTTGLYSAPATIPSPATVIIAAISQAEPTKMAMAQATISTPRAVVVAISPISASVRAGGTQTFTATLQNDAQNEGVTWSLSGAGCSAAACGTLSSSSSASGAAITYTAPAQAPNPSAVAIAATSVADSTKKATTSITVLSAPGAPSPSVSVTINPAGVSVQTGKTSGVTATVQNDTLNKGVTWTLSGAGCSAASCGTLSSASSASGAAITYTAPAQAPNPNLVTVSATSLTDSTKTASAIITILSAPATPSAAVSVTVSPAVLSVQTGKTSAIAATVQNDTQNKGVTWSLKGTGCSGAACGTLSAASSPSGAAITYTAPANAPTPATVTVTATSVSDTSKTSVATISITAAAPPPAAIVLTVNPASVAVQTGHTQIITAGVQNDTQNRGVNWALSGAGCSGATCGTLSAASGATVTYQAPASMPTPALVIVTATSAADATKTASATITLTAAVGGSASVAISPVRVALTTGQAQTFSATVTGNGNTAVTWEVDAIPGGNSSVGAVSATGVYSPPSSAGTHSVTARSVADTTATASANVAITDLAGVFTYHNDLSRDGVNNREYALNTSTVKAGTFGKRFACAIDASAYAQPLWVADVAIGGGTHNVIIAATQHDTVYAFDADASPCQTYWSKSLLASGETWLTNGDVHSDDITPDIGIVGTPVIDPNTKTLYVVSKSKNGSNFHQRLHALNLSDGSERFNGPQEIAFTSNGITFDPLRQNQRSGLALVNGVVYIAYASHGDTPTYYGWVVGYSASSLAQVSVFNDEAGSGYGGIWMAGGAPAADSSNNLYVITGNGDWDGVLEFGDSFLKLSTGSNMSVLSFFTPSNQNGLNNSDSDLGSGGAAILVDQPSGSVPHLLVGGGKEGKLFVLNRDNLGGNSDGNVVQSFSIGGSIFSTAAFWQSTLYVAPVQGHLQALTLNSASGTFTTTPNSQSSGTYGYPGATPSISAQGSSNGIVWTIERPDPVNGAILHAYDATNLGSELWNSGNNGADQAGQEVKFTLPTVANGKVYVGTATEISVYGLSPN